MRHSLEQVCPQDWTWPFLDGTWQDHVVLAIVGGGHKRRRFEQCAAESRVVTGESTFSLDESVVIGWCLILVKVARRYCMPEHNHAM